MFGITRYGSYLPYPRLPRAAFGGGKGERSVASYDEDAVSMAVEAAREVVADDEPADTLIFATTSPAYAEKLNAAAIQSALSLPVELRSLELGCSSRMGLAALLVGLDLTAAGARALVCASDVVVGAPGGPRERDGGDGAVAFATGPASDAIAVLRARASSTTELLDVWRRPEDRFASQWEERFGAETLGPTVVDTARRALAAGGVKAKDLRWVVLDAANPRALSGVPRGLGLDRAQLVDALQHGVGRTGAAHAGLVLAHVLDRAAPGELVLVVSAADGCDALVLETTERLAARRPRHRVEDWLASKNATLAYTTYLKWRGILPFEPPRRPEPERPAAPPMHRAEHWKMGFTGSRCTRCGAGHLPPQRVCATCGAVDAMRGERFADTPCTVATYTVDHLAYTLQPPVVAAIADFAGGGRMACELTDVDPAAVTIGGELEMTFRRLFTGQGVHNYFWKARPKR